MSSPRQTEIIIFLLPLKLADFISTITILTRKAADFVGKGPCLGWVTDYSVLVVEHQCYFSTFRMILVRYSLS